MSNRNAEPKTIIVIRKGKDGRPWLEAKRRPGDGSWVLWYRADRMALDRRPHVQHVEGYEEDTYTGWVQVNVARNVRTLLDTAPEGYL
jgi:hypothetical protein